MWLMGRAFQAAARVDPDVRSEVDAFPAHFSVILRVMPFGPKIVLAKDARGRLRYLGDRLADHRASVLITIKHLEAALLLLTFREGTALSFARNRMTVRGDLAHVMAIVRCLNTVQTYLLPAFVARKAIKRYPAWSPVRKHGRRLGILVLAVLGR